VRVHRLPGRRLVRIQFAVRGAQPAERDRPVVELCIEGKRHDCAVRIQLLQADENVHVVRALRRHVNLQLDVAGELDRLIKLEIETARSVPPGVAS